jgi:hypothetical protein
MSRMSENVGASTSHNPMGLYGLYRDNFTLLAYITAGQQMTQCGQQKWKTSFYHHSESCLWYRFGKANVCLCSTNSRFCTSLYVCPIFFKGRHQVGKMQVSSCTSLSGQESEGGSISRQHMSAEEAGPNTALGLFFYFEDGKSMFLRNYLTGYTLSHPL